MKSLAKFTCSLALISVASSNALAGWPELHHEMHVDRLRNNAWPQPFRGIDAAAVSTPFEIQKSNGWRQFNTIGSAFFDDSCALTDAGLQKIAVTLNKTPSNRRILFVHKGVSPEETASRVEAVQIAVSQLIPVGPLPEILVTDQDNLSVSGETQTLLNRGLNKSMPAPVLPKFNGLNSPSSQQQMNLSN